MHASTIVSSCNHIRTRHVPWICESPQEHAPYSRSSPTSTVNWNTGPERAAVQQIATPPPSTGTHLLHRHACMHPLKCCILHCSRWAQLVHGTQLQTLLTGQLTRCSASSAGQAGVHGVGTDLGRQGHPLLQTSHQVDSKSSSASINLRR
jgi:hypothetical protein